MTTNQTTKVDNSIITDNQEIESQTPIDLALDPWQNLNTAIPVFDSGIDSNADIRNLDDGGIVLNSETNTDMEIDQLVTNVSNEAPLLNTASDPEPFISTDFTLAKLDSSFVINDEMSDTANTVNIGEATDNTIDAAIEPTVTSNEPSIINSATDTGSDDFSNSISVTDIPELVDYTDNEIQTDDPLTDVLDVSDNSILDEQVITNEPLGVDDHKLNELVNENTDLLADSLIWTVFTIADGDIVDFGGLSPTDIDVTSGDNSGIFILGTLICNENYYLTYPVIEGTDNDPSLQLIGNTENTNTEGWIA